jgi:hypothetical protein
VPALRKRSHRRRLGQELHHKVAFPFKLVCQTGIQLAVERNIAPDHPCPHDQQAEQRARMRYAGRQR